MQRIVCRQCQASLPWDGVSELVKCEYCGTLYRMHPRTKADPGVSVGTGGVSPIRTAQGSLAGTALCSCFVPKNWPVETGAPEQFANVLAPLTMQLTMHAPEETCFVSYGGAQVYEHIDPTPQNAAQQGRLAHPSLVLTMSYQDAPSFCDRVVGANPNLRDVRCVSRTQQPDAFIRPKMEKAVADAAAGGLLEPGASWARCVYTCRDSAGRLWHKQVETLLSYGWIPPDPQEQMLYQMLQQNQARTAGRLAMLQGRFGGVFNAVQLPTAQAPQPKLRWCLHFLLETSATEEVFAQARTVHGRVRESYAQLPVFEQQAARLREQLRMQAMQEDQALGNALGQMNRNRMASWDRQQQIVSDLSSHTSSVMEQMRSSNDETMRRVRNLRSEAIRGVNTFYARPGFAADATLVEADTRWDHVYQNTQHPEAFAASTGEAPLEFGVDYEELKQTNGNY